MQRRSTLDKRAELHAAARCVRAMRALGVKLTPRAVLEYWRGYGPRQVGRRPLSKEQGDAQ